MKKIITFIFFITANKFYCQVNIPVTDSCACNVNETVTNVKDIDLNIPVIGQGLTQKGGCVLFTNEAEFRNHYKRYFSKSMIDSVIMISHLDFNSNNLILFWKWYSFGRPLYMNITISHCDNHFLQLNITLSTRALAVNNPTVKYIIVPKQINQIKNIKVCSEN